MRAILISLFILLFLSHCNDDKKHIIRLVREWETKEVLFPKQSIFTIQGKDTIVYPTRGASYKVLIYVDTMGCTSCKLKLSKWDSFIEEMDSLKSDSVKFYFFLFSKNAKKISHILRQEKFMHPVCIDTEDELNRLNNFPSDEMFQTFLLDKDNKVLVIGNPIHNPAVKALYLERITGKKQERLPSKTQVEIVNKEINLGNVSLSSGGKEAIFVLRNTGNNPLVVTDVVTTCGCTETNYEKKLISSGQETKVTVRFIPEEEGFFNKAVIVHCNAEGSPFKLNLKGTVAK